MDALEVARQADAYAAARAAIAEYLTVYGFRPEAAVSLAQDVLDGQVDRIIERSRDNVEM